MNCLIRCFVIVLSSDFEKCLSPAHDWIVETVCDEKDGDSNDPPESLCGPKSNSPTTNNPTLKPTRNPTGNPTVSVRVKFAFVYQIYDVTSTSIMHGGHSTQSFLSHHRCSTLQPTKSK